MAGSGRQGWGVRCVGRGAGRRAHARLFPPLWRSAPLADIIGDKLLKDAGASPPSLREPSGLGGGGKFSFLLLLLEAGDARKFFPGALGGFLL